MDATVYLIQEPTTTSPRDLSSANRYGKIISVLAIGDRPSMLPGPTLHKLRKGLRDFKPDDYLVWAGGDPLAMMLAGVVMTELGYREFKFLRWDRERGTDRSRTGGGFYIPTAINLRP